jgi:hypothetical protein
MFDNNSNLRQACLLDLSIISWKNKKKNFRIDPLSKACLRANMQGERRNSGPHGSPGDRDEGRTALQNTVHGLSVVLK